MREDASDPSGDPPSGDQGARGDARAQGEAAPPAASPLAGLFGLSPEEAGTVEALAREMLAESGVEAGRFFAGLDARGGIGAALGLTPALLEAIYARAHRWFAVGQPDKAEPLFRALCVADPGHADAFAGLGISLRVLGRLDAARLALDTAARLRPDWAVPPFHLCELALVSNDPAGAELHLAAFRALSDAATPAAMRAEAGRFAQALALRRGGGATARP